MDSSGLCLSIAKLVMAWHVPYMLDMTPPKILHLLVSDMHAVGPQMYLVHHGAEALKEGVARSHSSLTKLFVFNKRSIQNIKEL